MVSENKLKEVLHQNVVQLQQLQKKRETIVKNIGLPDWIG